MMTKQLTNTRTGLQAPKSLPPQVQTAIDIVNNLSKRSENTGVASQLREASLKLLQTGLPNLSKLLPLFFRLKGEPYTLANHYPFEPFFHTLVSRRAVWKTARQVSKSTSQASQGTLNSICVPFFNTLYVTPLYEMIRRFSNNYVKGFIDQSPIKNMFTGTSTSSNVLQRSFLNGSNMFFSFAFLDADRTRGLNNDKCCYDEVQDMDHTFIPIIRETMSGSRWGLEQFTGTPKTMDNTIEQLWLQSSQAAWVVPCPRCHYDNYACKSHDMDDMTGPWNPDISEENPGTICAKCKRPINPRTGMWHHRYPERIPDFAGHHVPQMIMPMHFADADKWRILTDKRQGLFNTSVDVYYNEVCGESTDSGAKLVTMTDLKNACVLWPNREEEAETHLSEYVNRVVAVDWGGGGVDGVSFTVYAVVGIRADGRVDVLFAYRSLTPHDFVAEAKFALYLVTKFHCQFIVHDYTGAGAYREQFIAQAGFPYERLIPVWYVRAGTQQLMRLVPGTVQHPRDHYKLDKARSLVLVCQQIKNGNLRFFEYDGDNKAQVSLVNDFLALVEEKVDSRTGRDIYTIIKQQSMTDDFAQAVNIGSCALWYITGQWPDAAATEKYKIGEDLLRAISPEYGMSQVEED